MVSSFVVDIGLHKLINNSLYVLGFKGYDIQCFLLCLDDYNRFNLELRLWNNVYCNGDILFYCGYPIMVNDVIGIRWDKSFVLTVGREINLREIKIWEEGK